MNDYEKTWDEFWERIVTNDGELNIDQIKRELHDYRTLMNQVSTVYDHITGSMISKPLTDPRAVIQHADRHYREVYEYLYGVGDIE